MNRQFPGGRRGGGGGGRGINPILLTLMLQLMGQINQLERKPPVTLGLMGLMTGMFFYRGHRDVPSSRRFALCPDRVISEFDVGRLIVSAFIHGDEWHLYHNMASFLWKGVNLEFKMGSKSYVKMIAVLLVLSHALVVVISIGLASCTTIQRPYRQCSVGFSAVLFALKVVLNHDSPSFSNIYGISLPTKYAAWLELVFIHLFVPNSSFLGHMSGILAGYIYIKRDILLKALSVFTRPDSAHLHTRPSLTTSYTYNSGTTGSHNSRASDEEYARKLQEEEYLNSVPPSDKPVDNAEIRRRRMNRFS